MQRTIDDGVIGYDYTRTEGSQPPVLFLHGAMGVRRQFALLRECFGDRAQLAVNFAAHGDSVIQAPAMNCERLAQDTLAVLDALDIEQVDIIGHSLGGYVGLLLAHRAPQRIRSVVTLGTKFYWTEDAIKATLNDLDHDLLRGHARAYESLSAMHAAGGIGETLRLMQSLIADFGRWQLDEDTVRKIEVPLLVSAGDHDTFVPPSEVARLFDTLDKKRNAMAIMPNTPHALNQLAIRCFEQAVRRFWERSGLA